MAEYLLVQRLPTVEEYQQLREAVGWRNMDKESTEIGLRNSLFSICVIDQERIIGYGRVIGDGSLYFYLQDIIVLPEFQGQGIGQRIMDSIMNYLNSHAKTNASIGLMAAKGAAGFYEKYGFRQRPPERPGMFLIWGHQEEN